MASEFVVTTLVPVVSRSRLASALVGLLALTGALSAAPAPAEAAEPWPSQVNAVYRIEFNGFDVGSVNFTANVSGQTYTVSTDAHISALLGAIQWRGNTRSAGTLAGNAPRPAGYTFDYNGTSKRGSIKMGFANDGITSIAHVPPFIPPADTAPVRDNHLKGVLDPLSAVMALSRSAGENPCGRRLAVFDGKQRFDLQFSYLRQEHVADNRPTGQPGVGFVCRVKYVPIAGHKANEETRSMAQSNGIEVALRPVPSAGLFIPYQITVPTGAGSAKLISQRIDIITRSEQIALSN